MQEYRKFLDPKVLNKISRLDLKARLIVEGFLSGMHRSPYYGFSVEFAQHREYSPGDEIRHLDWKVYGRSDRYYIKQYEVETNLTCYILLDASESMLYASKDVTKLEYASYIAASLAYLVLLQQDAVGFSVFDTEMREFVPPSTNPGHLDAVINILERTTPAGKTDVGNMLHNMAERIPKRGLVVLISDLLDEPARIISGLQHFRHKRHEMIVFHVLDPYEVTFPFERLTLFEGLEFLPKLLCEPRALRKHYLEEFGKFVKEMKAACLRDKIDYVQITTEEPLDVALTKYIATRMHR